MKKYYFEPEAKFLCLAKEDIMEMSWLPGITKANDGDTDGFDNDKSTFRSFFGL